jgi:serine/threonine-protein kinase
MIGPGVELREGRYRLERLLGRGGMASVWLARDERLDRLVAVKVLSDKIASDPEYVARFRREARVAAGLSHPNLVGVFDFAESEERRYLVMEYVPGPNLAERIARGEGVDCSRLAREILGAVAHIHAAGVLHRDIKPQNVLIAADGRSQLTDFGIAQPDDATSLTRTGQLLGTERYIAPEVMNGEPASARSDLHSCGVLLAECSGEDPPPRLEALVRRLREADPDRRPTSAAEALAWLERPPSPQPTTWSGTFALRRRWIVGFLAAAVLAAVIVVLVQGGDGDGGTEPQRATGSGIAGGGEAPFVVPTPNGDDPALGATLNQQGYELIQAGRYEQSIPVLTNAIEAFPRSTNDLDYAYAMFNLGNALRLAGRPEDAIPVLQRRLQIPNQEGVVRRELAAARAAAD